MKYFMGLMALFFTLCGNALGSVWYVDKNNVSGTEDGISWSTAFTSIQRAVDAASNAGGGEVWVAEGTYTASTNPVVTMIGGVDCYGGFSGMETTRSQRDWQAHATAIDGQNARQCVFGANNAVIDGFVIAYGYGGQGGGMYNYSSSPMVSNCTFMNNSAGMGGGMGNRRASPTVSNCTFTNNGDSGMTNGESASPTISSCTFTNNGSGIQNLYYCRPIITNCTFTDNKGRGMSSSDESSPTVINCTFTNNVGGIYCYSSSSFVVENCILWGNTLPEISKDASSSVSVTYSCVTGGYAGVGNIATDPLLVAASHNNLRLRAGSPCIDTGTVPGAPTTDIRGVPRPQGVGFDMGAYEDFGLSADFTANHYSGAAPMTVTFTDTTVIPGGSTPTWQWDFGDGATSAVQNPSHVFSTAGLSWVCLVVEANGKVDSFVEMITVGQIFRVDGRNLSGVEDGKTWATAFKSIQPAISTAIGSRGSDVWVAEGTYTAASDPVVTMKQFTHLYGGFAGTETARDQRDSQTRVTTIDGQNTRRCVVGASNATFDGFTIRQG